VRRVCLRLLFLLLLPSFFYRCVLSGFPSVFQSPCLPVSSAAQFAGTTVRKEAGIVSSQGRVATVSDARRFGIPQWPRWFGHVEQYVCVGVLLCTRWSACGGKTRGEEADVEMCACHECKCGTCAVHTCVENVVILIAMAVDFLFMRVHPQRQTKLTIICRLCRLLVLVMLFPSRSSHVRFSSVCVRVCMCVSLRASPYSPWQVCPRVRFWVTVFEIRLSRDTSVGFQ
jgi:hypothetical protein